MGKFHDEVGPALRLLDSLVDAVGVVSDGGALTVQETLDVVEHTVEAAEHSESSWAKSSETSL